MKMLVGSLLLVLYCLTSFSQGVSLQGNDPFLNVTYLKNGDRITGAIISKTDSTAVIRIRHELFNGPNNTLSGYDFENKIIKNSNIDAKKMSLMTLNPDANKDSTEFIYCEILGVARFLSNKVTIVIDFGQLIRYGQDARYKDQSTGKPIIFNSMIDALNFMGNNGWEFVQAYTVTESSQNVYHYLLKKTTSLIQSESTQ